MSEQTLSEALADIDIDLNITDEDIESAAIPANLRSSDDEVQDESTFVELSDEELEEISPVTDDEVTEDFLANEEDYEEETEAERRARTAQERINQAVRQAKEFQRRELQAVQYAKQLQEENKKLSAQSRQTSVNSAAQNLQIQESYSKEFESRIEAQADAAKRNLQKAYESGDPEAMAEAQQLIARTEADRSSLSQYKRELAKYKEDYKKWAESQINYQEPEYQIPDNYNQEPEPQYLEPSRKAQEWAAQNEWFGTDRVMTNVAFAVHDELVRSGIDLESDQYYSEINRRIRQELPHKFQEERSAGNTKPVQRVVSGTRTTGKGRNQNDRRIELSPTEQQLAKKLGVPFKEYAKQKMRLQRS
jgi:hypothetical protein